MTTWPCPQCGKPLRVEWRWRARIASLAGATMKLGTSKWPYLVCDCGFVEAGKVMNDG